MSPHTTPCPPLLGTTNIPLLYHDALADNEELSRLIQSLTVDDPSAPQPSPLLDVPEDKLPSQKIYTVHLPTHAGLTDQWYN